MTGAVFRHGPHDKVQPITGYAPLPGQPRDDQGRLILRYSYGGRMGGNSRAAEVFAQEAEAAKIFRGVRAQVEQERLL